MNDNTNKAEKLAAARRKLKEFQNQKNKENINNLETHLPTSCNIIANISQTDSTVLPKEPQFYKFDAENVNNTEFLNINTNEKQHSDLSNYFSNTNKNSIFFDTVQKPPQSNVSDPFISTDLAISTQTFFSEIPDDKQISQNSLTSPQVFSFAGYENSQQYEESTLKENVEKLKHDLATAESKIKMQVEALDILTAEREEIQLKLRNTLLKMDEDKENIISLKKQLQENVRYQEELQISVAELKRFKEESLSKEFALEQNFNDLKEKNDELRNNLEMQKEKNNITANQLQEAQSYRDMLTLKFQQLGIEMDGDTKNYHDIYEESNSIKQKCRELEEQLKTLLFEKEHTDEEYRQYIVNMKEKLHETCSELEKISIENQSLVHKISSQTEHIHNLEKQLQKGPVDETKESMVNDLKHEIHTLKQEIEEEKKRHEQLLLQMSDYNQWKEKALDLEYNLKALKSEIMNSGELQMAVESNKVAASQAISQNKNLKTELERLNEVINSLMKEKEILNQMLEEERTKNCELIAVRDKPSHTTMNNNEVLKNDAAINTDGDDNDENSYGKTNIVAMLQLQEKFKNVLDKMADLTDEKQQLEHLVMQLQSETETIEEYVALYQKQRSILKQRAHETDFKMERITKEKERLLNIIRSILTTNEFDCSFVKHLVERNLSTELSDELAHNNNNLDTSFQEMNSQEFKNDRSEHHPTCHCCSGKLITV